MVMPTVVGGIGEIDRVNAFGQVVERDFVGGVPQVIGGFPSYAPTYAAPTTVVGAPAYSAPATTVVEGPTYASPTTVFGSYGGFGEIDKVNAFGQVVERDFVGG